MEMFKQMAISAPVAMLIIFLLLWFFFRKLTLIVAPMIVAMVSAVGTMGLLVVTGHTIHIMSSMIPIFIMPIAVLDAVHIISEFFDRYGKIRDRRRTVREVMQTLFTPMFFTSLTTAAGFLSLALTPIPPVQVFGIFVSAGVLLAWLWTITFVPAFITFIPERRLADLAVASDGSKVLMFPSAMLAVVLVGFDAMAAEQAAPSVGEIVRRTNLASYYQGRDGRADVSMKITDSQGRERQRRFTILRWDQPGGDKKDAGSGDDFCGQQKFYVYFHRPADVNKMVFSPSDLDAYLRPAVKYKLTDSWSVELGGNVFFGEEEHTFFAQFARNTNVYLGLRFSF